MDNSCLGAYARGLRAYLKRHRIVVNHAEALDLIAAMPALMGWREVKLSQERVAAALCDEDAWQRLASRIAQRCGKVLSPEELRQALELHPFEKGASSTETQSRVVTNANSSGGYVLKFEEVNEETGEPTGRTASFLGVVFKPLQYSDLINLKLDKVNIPLRWDNARVIDSTIPDISVEKAASGSTALESRYSSKTIGLVNGGWLPSGLALKDDMIVLPDRCTISELYGRFRDGEKMEGAHHDFVDFFTDRPLRINPLLFAMEGNLRKSPPPEVVKQQFEEACRKITAALPNAELLPRGGSSVDRLVQLATSKQPDMERDQHFLLRVSPILSGNVSRKRLPLVWKEVLRIASDCGVPRRSLVVIAALSAACVPNGKSPAKKLLKLTAPTYSAKEAYNGLADLRSLEILILLFAAFPNQRFVLCTGDIDLALFWAGIRASGFAFRDGHVECKFSPVQDLLPNVLPEQAAWYVGDQD